jgi:hypothetical protein
MYRHTHSALGLAALTGGGLHAGGINLLWASVLTATLAGAAITVGHIALGLGFPHPRNLAGGLRRRLTSGDTSELEPNTAEA